MDESTARALLAFAQEAGRGLDGLDRKALFAQLERRYADLVEAMRWFIEAGQTDDALSMANALARFWTASGRLEEGSRWFERVLRAPGGGAPDRGRACFEAGLIEFWRGDDESASALHRQALELGRRIPDPTVSALALTGLPASPSGPTTSVRHNVSAARRLPRARAQRPRWGGRTHCTFSA